VRVRDRERGRWGGGKTEREIDKKKENKEKMEHGASIERYEKSYRKYDDTSICISRLGW